jgi:lipocalin
LAATAAPGREAAKFLTFDPKRPYASLAPDAPVDRMLLETVVKSAKMRGFWVEQPALLNTPFSDM